MQAKSEQTGSKLLVVTHKEFDSDILPRGYEVVKVGNGISDAWAESKGWLTDALGESISSKNSFYCELTAYYWLWKNYKGEENDPVGISHYRRYFIDYKKKSKEITEDIVSEKKIRSVLKTHKAILSFASVKNKGCMTFDRRGKLHGGWEILYKIIKRDYPQMESTMIKCMKSRKTVYGNVIIARKSVFDQYCCFLFDILNKYDKEIESKGGVRPPRVDGYLSEHLLWIWSQYFLSEKDIYRMEIRNIEDDNLGFIEYRQTLPGKVIKQMKCNRFALTLYRKAALLYLMITR